MPAKEPKLYAIPAAAAFAERVRSHLGIAKVESMDVKSFPCGETRVDIADTVRGENVYLVGWGVGAAGAAGAATVNENLVQLMVALNAFKLASARKITVVYPNLPYSRQDRKDASRQPITAKMLADVLKACGAQHLITMDLHAAQIQGFYDFPVDNLYGSPTLVTYIAKTMDRYEPVAVVSPDAGGRKRVEDTVFRLRRAGFMDVEMVYMNKRRDPKTGDVVEQQIIGEPAGRHCVLVDDMGDTCGTLIRGAAKLREVDGGVLSVTAAVTHGVFSRDAVAKLLASAMIDTTYVTDTCLDGAAFEHGKKIKVLSVADLFAGAIQANHCDGSVSHLFA